MRTIVTVTPAQKLPYLPICVSIKTYWGMCVLYFCVCPQTHQPRQYAYMCTLVTENQSRNSNTSQYAHMAHNLNRNADCYYLRIKQLRTSQMCLYAITYLNGKSKHLNAYMGSIGPDHNNILSTHETLKGCSNRTASLKIHCLQGLK